MNIRRIAPAKSDNGQTEENFERIIFKVVKIKKDFNDENHPGIEY